VAPEKITTAVPVERGLRACPGGPLHRVASLLWEIAYARLRLPGAMMTEKGYRIVTTLVKQAKCIELVYVAELSQKLQES
jgi:hypothetical protein